MTRLSAQVLVLLGLLPRLAAPLRSQTAPDSLDSVVAQVRLAAESFRSSDSARLRGYIRLRPTPRVPGLNPFVGEHWYYPRWLQLPSLDATRPAYLMYYPIGGAERLVGVGYAFLQPSGAPPPSDFAGATPNWHLHHPCTGLPGMGSLLVGSAAGCRELGGQPGTTQIVMLHVWLVPNPDGLFGSENPALPFVATGLHPPDSLALTDPDTGKKLRELGLALAETIGARPRYGTMTEFGPDSLRFHARAEPLRARLRLLAEKLQGSEQRGDRSDYAARAEEMVQTWRRLSRVYLELAPTDLVRRLLKDWLVAVLNPGSHLAAH